MTEVLIVRYPRLMEDEGRHEYVMGPLPRAAAIQWVHDQKGQYFTPGDYYLVTVGHAADGEEDDDE
jgi:hypothetical protein